MKKTSLKSIIVLVSICLLIGAAMAAINAVTAPKIDEANMRAEQEALEKVLPENGGFEKIEGEFSEGIAAFYRDLDGDGYVAMLSVKGYDASKPMSIAVGLQNDGTIIRCEVISVQGETSGIGSKVKSEAWFSEQFEGKTHTLEGVDTIGGATISSSAFKNAVGEAARLLAVGEVK